MKYKKNKQKGYFGVSYTNDSFYEELYEFDKLDEYDPTEHFVKGDGCFCKQDEDLFCGDCMRRLRDHLLEDVEKIQELADEADKTIKALKLQNAKYRTDNKKLKEELTDTHRELAKFEQRFGKLSSATIHDDGEFDNLEIE